MNRGLAAAVVLSMVAAACGGSDDDGAEDTSTSTAETTTTTAAPATSTTTTTSAPATTTMPDTGAVLTLSVAGWPNLAGDFRYEAWAIVAGDPVSAGKFEIGPEMDEVLLEAEEDISAATQIVITIEPAGDTDASPAATHFLAGDVEAGSADLSIEHAAALGIDLGSAAGTVDLATPSDGNNTNELSGIWFLRLPGPVPSLELPDLPAGWKYEGWAVVDDVPLSSGTLVAVDQADEAAPYGADGRMPDFPGEDYLRNAPPGVTLPTDLGGNTVFISVEPFPDDDPGPFALEVLSGVVPEPAQVHVSYDLVNQAGAFPTGTARLGA